MLSSGTRNPLDKDAGEHRPAGPSSSHRGRLPGTRYVQGESGSVPSTADTSQPQDFPPQDIPTAGHPDRRVGTDPGRYPQLSPRHRFSILQRCIIILKDRGQILHWVKSSSWRGGCWYAAGRVVSGKPSPCRKGSRRRAPAAEHPPGRCRSPFLHPGQPRASFIPMCHCL